MNSIAALNKKMASSKSADQQIHESAQYIIKTMDKYGKNVMKQAGTLDDVCEREVEQ